MYAMAVSAAAALVACSGEPEVTLPSRAPAAAASTPALTAAEEAVLAQFHGLRELEVELYTDPDVAQARERLPAYATGRLLSSLAGGVDALEIRNQARVGQPAWDPVVVEVGPDRAVVRDCYEATEWALVDRDTGEPAPERDTIGVGGANLPTGRHVMRYEAVLGESHEWLFEYAEFERDEQC